MRTADGRPLGALRWEPARPGSRLVRTALPLIVLGSMAVAIGTLLVLRRAHVRGFRRLEAVAARLKLSETRFRDFAEAASDWLWETDADGRFSFLSDRHAEVLGVPNVSRLGRTRWELGLPEDDGESGKWETLKRTIEEHQAFRDFRYRMVTPSGRTIHVKINGRPVWDEAGTYLGFRGTGSDLTAETEAAARAEHLALHDPLTGLPNRVLLLERIDRAIAAAIRFETRAAVLCLDLFHFKEINDIRGHVVGDQLLKATAELLLGNVREADTVSRLGGDEFAILRADISSLREVELLCERLLEVFSQPFMVDGQPTYLRISIGVAFAPVDGRDPAELLRHADVALYRAKSQGAGEFCFFEPVMDAELRSRKQLELDLHRALANDELEVHHQPQIDIETGRIVGVEASPAGATRPTATCRPPASSRSPSRAG